MVWEPKGKNVTFIFQCDSSSPFSTKIKNNLYEKVSIFGCEVCACVQVCSG